MVLKRRRPARTCPLLVMWTSGRPSASLRLCPQFRFTTCQRQTRDGTKSARPADLRRGRCKWNCPGNRFRSSPLDSSTGSRFIRNTVESSGSICGTHPCHTADAARVSLRVLFHIQTEHPARCGGDRLSSWFFVCGKGLPGCQHRAEQDRQKRGRPVSSTQVSAQPRV